MFVVENILSTPEAQSEHGVKVKVAPEFCRSFKMVAARPQEDRLQEVFEEWRCQHDRINTSAEYCVRQAGGLQMPDTLSHITSYTWTPCNVRT